MLDCLKMNRKKAEILARNRYKNNCKDLEMEENELVKCIILLRK